MQIEDYFDFQAPNDIRIKGSRIGIETVLYDYIHRSMSPEEIDQRYWSINLEQVYATILYYLHNKEEVHQYLTEWIEHGERMREEQEKNPDPVILRLRALREKYGKDAARIVAAQRGLALAEPAPKYDESDE
ncbi:MAG: DUF433 domain-containing protein [Chloroflexi bacterium]|nr:DUF433 domain-containing protein [Chloroflexota bacterium]